MLGMLLRYVIVPVSIYVRHWITIDAAYWSSAGMTDTTFYAEQYTNYHTLDSRNIK